MPSFRRAVLLYNPSSGQRRAKRLGLVEAAAAVFKSKGIEVELEPTRAANSAGEQARAAIARGCDAVFIAGGDGTINEAIQGIVGSNVIVGTIPLGTGNVLARELGIPFIPSDAAAALADAPEINVPIAMCECVGRDGAPVRRHFLIIAGAGPDAHMAYRITAAHKKYLGIAAYGGELLRLLFAYHYAMFDVSYTGPESSGTFGATQLFASRIPRIRPMLRLFTPGAGLLRNDLRVLAFKTRRRLSFFRYVMGALVGRHVRPRDVDLFCATEMKITPRGETPRLYVEVDGDCIGRLPATIAMTPHSIRLLAPHLQH